jgi:hypothetical protein
MKRLTCLLRSMQGLYFVTSVTGLNWTATVMGLQHQAGCASLVTKPACSQVLTVLRSESRLSSADLLFGSL